MRMRVFALVVASLVLGSSGAQADEPEDDDARPVMAVAAGAGLMFASGAAGFTVVGADRHRDGKDWALVGAQTGIALAPLVAHGIVGEWDRGLWFSIPGAVGALGTAAVVQALPDIVKRGPPMVQYALSATLVLSVFGNSIGVFDAVFAPKRKARDRAATTSSLWLAPTLGGAMLMGTL